MAEIRWSDLALQDIDNIAEYIAKDSEKYASIQVERFFQETEILETFPFTGRIVPELKDKNIREIVIGNYRIIYRVFSELAVDILTVHHGSRLIKNNKRFNKSARSAACPASAGSSAFQFNVPKTQSGQ